MNLLTTHSRLVFTLIASSAFTVYAFNNFHEEKPVVTVAKPVDFEVKDTMQSFPTIMVLDQKKNNVPLRMNALKADIRIAGNIAVTKLDMMFYNDEDRVLEGELYFPLAAGQTVSSFAMEVDGKLREGVVVEKKEARIAYESTIRQNIDPGLLEWTKGNNFKARIFPIPTHGNKHIVVSYTQELQEVDGQLQYYMPMRYKDKLKNLDVKVEVLKQEAQPFLVENELHNFRFEKWQDNFKGEMSLKDVHADKPLCFGIPFAGTRNTMFEEVDSTLYFYTVVHPKKGTRTKALPKSLSLVWDVSGSSQGRDLEKELSLLKTYLERIGNATVELVTFSNEIHEKQSFTVTPGNTYQLLDKLRTLDYDGATQLGSIDFSQLTGQEVILSSDCLDNFGEKATFSMDAKPVYVWNSNPSADHSNAQYISDKTRGQYLDLTTLTAAQAMDKMTLQHLRFLGVRNNPYITVTTDRANSFTENFSIAGTAARTNTQLALEFGYGNEPTEIINVDLDASMLHDFDGLTAKIWAQKRVAELDIRGDLFKDEITRLGKKHGIVTRNTSLLILDRIEDYVTHRIPPPAEMRKVYDKLVAVAEKQENKSEKSHMETVVAAFKERKTWWNQKFDPKPIAATQEPIRAQVPLGNIAYSDAAVESNAAPSDEHVMSASFSATGASSATYSFNKISPLIAPQEALSYKWDEAGEPRAQGSIEVENWNPSTPYLKKIKAAGKGQWYKAYLSLKKTYEKQPSFYIDVADFFIKQKDNKTALRVLSNIAEMELENPQLLRILGHRLEQLNYNALAISVFKEVKEMRPEEPQSYRDLGLLYAKSHEDQKAVDELYYVVSHSWDGRFNNIESLVAVEMNTIIANASKPLNISAIDPRLVYAMPVDMRVVINWDTDNCDIDLWVTDPRGEKCLYSNNRTAAGGRLSDDFTGGYGPEEFIIKKAIPGDYKIEANYFGNSSQTITGATTIQVQMITNYGRKSKKTQEVTRRLESEAEILKLATFSFKGS